MDPAESHLPFFPLGFIFFPCQQAKLRSWPCGFGYWVLWVDGIAPKSPNFQSAPGSPNVPLSTGRARLCPGRSGGDSWPEWAARPSCEYQIPGVGEPSASQSLAEFPHPSLSRFSLLQGQKGQPGVPGVPGSPGSPGPPGISIKVSLEHSSGMCHRKRRSDSKNCRWRSLETSPKALLSLGSGNFALLGCQPAGFFAGMKFGEEPLNSHPMGILLVLCVSG